MTDNDDSLFQDLVGFLKSDRADLRQAAAEASLASVTTNGASSVHALVTHGAIPPLCRLMTCPGKTGHDALATLLIMSYQQYTTSTSNAIVPVTSALALVVSDNNNKHTTITPSYVEDAMLDANVLSRVTDVALSFTDLDSDNERRHVFRAMSLLANLTRTEQGAAGLLLLGQVKEKDLTIISPSLQLMLARFLSDRYVRLEDTTATTKALDALSLLEEEEEDEDDDETLTEKASLQDPYLHFASVLTNLTQINAGRHFVTNMHMTTVHSHNNSSDDSQDATTASSSPILPPLLRTLLFQLRHSHSSLRRRAIASTIKNCCFDTNISKLWLLPLRSSNKQCIVHNHFNRESEDMVTPLLYPLMGPEQLDDADDILLLDPMLYALGPDKRREPDPKTRQLLVETLLLLCASGRTSREVLRSKGAYIVLKYADLVEEEEDVGEKISECVQFLKRDEEGMQEGESDNLALEMARERMRLKREQEDYDDVD